MEREINNKELVDRVFNDELHMIRPMIRDLQSGIEDEIETYSDLEIPKAAIIQHDLINEVHAEATNTKQLKMKA